MKSVATTSALVRAVERNDRDAVCKHIQGVFGRNLGRDVVKKALLIAACVLLERQDTPSCDSAINCRNAICTFLVCDTFKGHFDVAMAVLEQLGMFTIVEQEARLHAVYYLNMYAVLCAAIKQGKWIYVQKMLSVASERTRMNLYWSAVRSGELETLKRLHEFGRDYSDIDNYPGAVTAIKTDNLAMLKFLLPFVHSSNAYDLVLTAKWRRTCDALALVLADSRFKVDLAWLAPEARTTPNMREFLDTEVAARNGEMRLDVLATVAEALPLPFPLVCEVHSFMHNSVDPAAQAVLANAIFNATH